MLFKSVFADSLYYGVSEELSSTPESSSSKHSVELFNSPLSTSVITASDIKKIGATTIPEALRLVPGVLVRELTNGQYEVHIRGFESAPSGGSLTSLGNQNSLIMIDNRVVYDYFLGGIFWETLPINMNDIERIEVVRGPSTALYGPNAVTGVIHIITKREQISKGNTSELRGVFGTQKTGVIQFTSESTILSQFLRVSANIDQRDRYQSEYYGQAQQQYLPLEQINLAIEHTRHPRVQKAKDTSAFNLSLYNDPTNILAYDLNYSHQDSWSQKAFLASRNTILTTNESNSDALNIKINYGNLYARSSYHTGKQKTLGFPDFDYSFDITQTNIEYVYQLPSWILRPGFRYDDIAYEGNFIGGKRSLKNHAFMLRAEARPNSETSLVAALSYDKYNIPDDYFLNFQLLGSYRFAYDTLFRAGIERAHRSSFFVNSFLDVKFSPINDTSQRLDFTGNENTPLMIATTYEIGIRHEFTFYNWLDIEFFHTTLSDQSEFIQKQTVIDGLQTVTPNNYEATPTESIQLGLTADWHYEDINWDLNLFLTLQDTDVKDQYANLSEPLTFFDAHNKGTPAFYGGLNTNWQPAERWNLNANIYLMDEYTTILEAVAGSQKNSLLALANFNVSHQYSSRISLHGAIKNLARRNRSQYFYTDKIRPHFQVGINISWGK